MGQDQSNSHQVEIKVATLNYSGILKSPYEFYESFQQDCELSFVAKKVFQKNKQLFNFDFGPLDREWQETRYSPLYVPSCGIKNNVHLMNQKQFQDKWENWRQKQADNLAIIYDKYVKQKQKVGKKVQPLETYLKNMRGFDFSIYQSLIEYIYGEEDEAKRERLMSDLANCSKEYKLDFQKYKEFQRTKFQKPFLNQDKKVQITINAIQKLNIDILFLQEANQKLVEAVEKKGWNLRIVKSCMENSTELKCQSVIIIRENRMKFPKFHSLLLENTRLTNNINWLKTPLVKPVFIEEEDIMKLNFNQDTVVQMLYNIILICPHLSSKKDRNKIQTEQMMKQMIFLKEKFPNCYIIVAGDLNNNQIKQAEIPIYHDPEGNEGNKFNVVPDCSRHYTAKKMRTDLQAQPNKANDLNIEVKDYIISDMPIKQWSIQTIGGNIIFSNMGSEESMDKIEEIKKKIKQLSESQTGFAKSLELKTLGDLHLLPSEVHPYDHYIVTATLVAQQGLEHVTDIDYKFKYKPDELTHEELERVAHVEGNKKR